ncbi:hypothetical protein DMENIID0001_146900 [Sergentomyia squamirostris]
MKSLVMLGIVGASEAALNLAGPQCGSISCHFNEYCSKYTKQCESCEKICSNNTHNSDQVECQENCHNYIYSVFDQKLTHLTNRLDHLENRQKVLLIITIIVLILFLIIHGLHFARWLHRRGYFSLKCLKVGKAKNKSCPVVDLTHANPDTQSPKLQMRIDMARNAKRDSTVYSVDGSTIHTVSTPVSTRYPAEDSTLDYSYDNRGMTVTPVTDKPRPETTF